MIRRWLLLLLILILLLPIPSRAQSGVIRILEPTDGAVLSGAFTVRGDSTVPADTPHTLRIRAANGGTVLASAPLTIQPQQGQPGTFSVTLNFNVAGDTPIDVEVAAEKDGQQIAAAKVRVTLKPGVIVITATPLPATPVPALPTAAPQDETAVLLATLRLALLDYSARIQVVQPLPLSIAPRTFVDSCLELKRGAEACTPAQIEGSVVKISYGGATYTYHVGNNQARLNQNESEKVKPPTAANVPKIFSDAVAATGIPLFVPRRFSGPFQGLLRSRVEWTPGAITITYAAEGNPVSAVITEKPVPVNGLPPAPAAAESVVLSRGTFPVQVADGRKIVTWPIEGTVISVSVPISVSNNDLADFANSFAALNATDPGQTNPLDRSQFDRLTLALPEPTRSVELARQAALSLFAPPRKGVLVAVQAKRFNDSCLELKLNGDSNCTAAVTSGYVIGIADSELYRYHATPDLVRLNRGNSALVDKSGADHVTVDAARTAAGSPIVATNDPDFVLLGAQTGQFNNVPGVLLIYRDNKSGGVFALRETSTSNPVPVTQPSQASDGAITELSPFTQPDGKFTTVALWASPEIGLPNTAKIKTSLVAK